MCDDLSSDAPQAIEQVRRRYPVGRARLIEAAISTFGGRRLVQLDVRAPLASVPKLRTTYPRLLMLPQDQTERILTDHLSGLGVVIERGVTFEGLVQREDAVQAELCHRDGRQQTVAARWLIGADGTSR